MNAPSPSSSTAGKRVGIWIRVSTEDQANGESPHNHEKRARLYAEAKGWTVVELYDLAGVSGKSVMQHPEARRMLADVKRRHITGLIFSKLARLARNTKELLEFADIFHDHNADLISLQESIDTCTPAGRLFYTMIAAMAQWEREEIGDRIKASLVVRAKMGKPLSGSSSFGYRWVDKKLVVDPKEAPVLKLAFELYLKFRRKGTVARELNRMGHRTRNGNQWCDTSVSRMLTHPTSKGVQYLNVYKKDKGWNRSLKPEEEWGRLEVEPIVSGEMWDGVNRIIEEQHKTAIRPGKKVVRLFAGLLLCECGQKMYVPSKSPKYICAKCHNKIPIEDMDALFLDEMKGYFSNGAQIAAHIAEAKGKIAEKEKLVDLLRQEIKRVREEMQKTHRMFLDGKIEETDYGSFYDPLRLQLTQLQEGLPALESELDLIKVTTLSADQVMYEASELYSNWETLPLDTKRSVVESLIEKIVAGKDFMEITFSSLPSSQDITKTQQLLIQPVARG